MNSSAEEISFEEWFRRANQICSSQIGIGLDDLPDRNYHEMYEGGLAPEEAVQEVMDEEVDYGGL